MDSVVAAVMSALEHLRLALQGVPGLAAVTSAPYMFRPFIMLMFLGIAAGLVGVIVNLRCLEFNAEAMVHSVFPGIVAGALYWGIDNIVPGAAVVAVIVAVALTWLGRSRRINEAGTAIVLTSFFGFGGAMASGMSATAVDFLANAAIAAVVVASSSAVGVLLVIGYLVVPGAAARLVTHRISTMVPVAILVGVAGGWFGMWLMTVDSPHPISPQAAVALSVLALYALLLPVGYVMRKRGTGA